MLSRKDIESELGKGINIFPLHSSNIKGNSINFTTSRNAWSFGRGQIVKDKNGKWIIAPKGETGQKKYDIMPGKSALINEGKKNIIILLPHATTIIETSEVIGVDNHIGGTLHSKVGMVAKGIGDIGTMLGPSFCGHLMISLHNITDEVIEVKVGETFVSLVFYYLKTPDKTKNTNVSGHVDKLAELGIQISQETREYLTTDWKMSLTGIRDKMMGSADYKTFEEKIKKEKYAKFKSYLNWQNFIIVSAYLIAIVAMILGAYYLDSKSTTKVWTERAYTVIISGVIVPFIISSAKHIKQR